MGTSKRDRQKANHAAKLAAQQAAARARRLRIAMIWSGVGIVAVVAILLLLQPGGDADATTSTTAAITPAAITPATTTAATTTAGAAADETTPSTAAPATAYDGYLAQPAACDAEAPAPRTEMSFDAPEDQGLTGRTTATIETSCGAIEVALDADASPETVNSFAFLAGQGFYDGTVCHRVVPGFMIQCGDPTATGTGGPGYTLPDEFPDPGFAYEHGVLAMANAGSGTTGSQFFIVTGDASHLGPEFSLLGTVVGGDETLALLDQVPVGLNAQGTEESDPQESIYLETVVVAG